MNPLWWCEGFRAVGHQFTAVQFYLASPPLLSKIVHFCYIQSKDEMKTDVGRRIAAGISVRSGHSSARNWKMEREAGRRVAGWLRCSGRFLINRPFHRWRPYSFVLPDVLSCAEGTALPLTGKAVELGRTILVPPSVARIGKTLSQGGRGHAVGLYLLLIGATCTTTLIRQRGSESWVGATRSPILRRHLCVAL